ncbi:MAG: esterase-like activity of phytase family protein [Bacteroidales bacterium]|nr:esterase-like activity of phytase family protein [Bacteroidales bacterium]MBR5907020.1 esterase-like activity of phytase family protein [Bacteroidales bacterium]
MKNITRLLIASSFVVFLFSCTKQSSQGLEPDVITPDIGGKTAKVTMVTPPVSFAGETKSAMVVNESTGLSFVWSAGDQTGVYSTTDGFALFNLTGGTGTSSATFNGGGFNLIPGDIYYSFFPYASAATEKTEVPISYASQTLTADNDMVSPMSKDYMYASAVATVSGADFSFNHIGSFVRMKMGGLTEDLAVSSVDIIPMYNEVIQTANVDVTKATNPLTTASTSPKMTLTTTGVTVPSGNILTLWAAMAPQNFSTDSWAIVSHSGDDIYSVRVDGKNLEAGKAYRYAANQIAPTGYSHGFTVNILEQKNFGTGLGQYSAIVWLGENNYAVVDDKLNGGGLVSFTIPIDGAGVVGAISTSVMPGTSSSGVTNMDNEGVAYYNSKLYVTAEADQSIREYDNTGVATGNSFTVPADMAVEKITANAGFEAFTYNAATHKFWTTTEAPLQKDNFIPRLHRLQSFGEDFQPIMTSSGRFLYQMDAPQYSSAGAYQYVHGISAMTALDDGRLIILEREVRAVLYPPSANGVAKLYVVDPVHDTAGILRKSLLATFITGGDNLASLANYEGMCLGPTLSDGSRCIILISDSQGIAKEFLQVVTIK